jgi:predicted kinase
MLVIFAGLPGVGKSTIARAVARELEAVSIRIDTIEQAMRDGGLKEGEIGGMGYTVAQRVASENLRLGHLVVADMVNPWQVTRDAWRQVARDAGAIHLDVEIVCSDLAEHRRRVESRLSDVEGLVLPTWQDVLDREYHPWDVEPFRIDSAKLGIDEAAALVVKKVRQRRVR